VTRQIRRPSSTAASPCLAVVVQGPRILIEDRQGRFPEAVGSAGRGPRLAPLAGPGPRDDPVRGSTILSAIGKATEGRTSEARCPAGRDIFRVIIRRAWSRPGKKSQFFQGTEPSKDVRRRGKTRVTLLFRVLGALRRRTLNLPFPSGTLPKRLWRVPPS